MPCPHPGIIVVCWPLFEGPGVSWGGSWGLLGSLGVVLEGFWSLVMVRWSLFEGLGPLGEGPGVSWGWSWSHFRSLAARVGSD